DELAVVSARDVAIRERRGVLVRERIEIVRLLEALEGCVLFARAHELIGRAREVRGLALRVAREEAALPGGLRRAVPLVERHKAALGRLPELGALEHVRGFGVRLSRAERVVQLLAELAEALEEVAARNRVVDRRRVVGDDRRGHVEL